MGPYGVGVAVECTCVHGDGMISTAHVERAQCVVGFAISALSFEDVGTAVKELRVALQALEPYVR